MKHLLLLLVLFISFQHIHAIPVITSFSPTSGPIGTSVTIIGTGFSSVPTSNTVFFGAIKATVTAASTTQLSVAVPIGATYQYITVMVSNLVAYSASPFIATFCSDGIINTSSFAAPVNFITGSEPSSVAIGDIDGDGKSDLAVANESSNTVSVFRNTSTIGVISFATKIDFITDSSPYSVAIGDIDGDGKPDLAVSNRASNTFSVLRNTSTSGNISFASRVDYTTDNFPQCLAISDIEGDGKSDLAVTNLNSNTVSVFRNTSTVGTISFATKVDFTTGNGPLTLSIGDIDGNGKPDLAISNVFSNTVSVFRNTCISGTISFAAKVDFAAGSSPYSVSIGDIDGNGKPDLAVTNNSSNTVSVFRNTSISGTISFAAKVDFSTGSNPRSVSIGIVDGKEQPDLAVVNGFSNTVSVLRNTSTAGIISFAAKIDFTTGSNPYSIAIGDIDGNEKSDLVIANYNSSTISVFRNQIATVLPIVTSASSASICSGDPVNISLTSNTNSNFIWYATDNPNTTGESTTTQTSNYINNVLTNSFPSNQIINYTVTPISINNSNCVGLPQTITVTVASLNPPTSGTGAFLCNSDSATISAIPGSGGAGILWYTTLIGGTPLATGTSYTGFFNTTTTLYASHLNNASGCESSSRIPVVVTVENLSSPFYGIGAVLCKVDSATISASPANGGNNIRWYNSLTGGSVISTGLFYSDYFDTTTSLYASTFNDSTGCESNFRIPVIATLTILDKPISASDILICQSGDGTSNAIPSDFGNTIRWYTDSIGGTFLFEGLIYTSLYDSSTVIYSSSFNTQTGCESEERRPVNVTAFPLPEIERTATNATYGNNGTINTTVSNGQPPYSFDWSNDGIGDFDDSSFISGLTSGLYLLTVSDQRGCKNSIDVAIANGEDLFIPTGFSPNSDGINDTWEIPGSYQYDDIVVSVFNLQGQLIYYQKKKYLPWDGKYQGELVPTGDYYFVIESLSHKRKQTGTLTVKY